MLQRVERAGYKRFEGVVHQVLGHHQQFGIATWLRAGSASAVPDNQRSRVRRATLRRSCNRLCVFRSSTLWYACISVSNSTRSASVSLPFCRRSSKRLGLRSSADFICNSVSFRTSSSDISEMGSAVDNFGLTGNNERAQWRLSTHRLL